MTAIIKWLSDVENNAHMLYNEGSEYFSYNEKLSSFLKALAADELFHYQTISEIWKKSTEAGITFETTIFPDEDLNIRILKTFTDNIEKLHQGVLTENDIYNCLIRTEFSEWNAIFIYIIKLASRLEKSYNIVVEKIYKHLDLIEDYFDSNVSFAAYKKDIEQLPDLKDFSILIVDDDESIQYILKEIFTSYNYSVDIVNNGFECLENLKHNHYDIIISDIDMPVMGGVELFMNLSSNPGFNKDKIIFMSGSHAYQSFIHENNLKFIPKPFSIKFLVDQVDTTLFKIYISDNKNILF